MFYARLKDGNTAYKYIRHLLEGKTTENMLNVLHHFQIDGNFGFTTDGDTRLTVRYQDKKTVLDLKKGVSSPLFWS
jgi:hypothetical protein